jgi:Domain of unknown function (DUF4313)
LSLYHDENLPCAPSVLHSEPLKYLLRGGFSCSGIAARGASELSTYPANRAGNWSTAMNKVKFLGHVCDVEVTTYRNGRTALILNDARTGEEVTVATVNIPEIPVTPGETFIKDYSENEGVLKALEEAGWVKSTGERVHSGFVEIPKVTVLGRDRARSFNEILHGRPEQSKAAEQSRDVKSRDGR